MGLILSRNLRKPESTCFGWLIGIILTRGNASLEQHAAVLCEIQPNFNVLEVGFGPGIGLKAAFTYIKDGQGRVYGIDLSECMVKLAASNLEEEITTGKVHITQGDVMKLPYNDDTFDRIFHCNCCYFWDDMNSAIMEMRRVLKADGKIICLQNLYRLQKAEKFNLMQCGNTDSERYVKCLRRKFQTVDTTDIMVTDKITLQAIFASNKK